MDHKKLEEKIIGKLQQNLKVPTGFSWAEMESGIKRPVEKPKRKRFIYLLGLGIGILLIAILHKSNEAKNNSDLIRAYTIEDSFNEKASKEYFIKDNDQDNNLSGSAKMNNYAIDNSKNLKLIESTIKETTSESIHAVDIKKSKTNLPLSANIKWSNDAISKKENQINNLSALESNIKKIIKPIITDIDEPSNKEIRDVFIKHLDNSPLYVSIDKYEADYMELPQYKMADKLSNISIPSKWKLGISSGLNVIDFKTSSSIQRYSNILDQASSKRFGYSLGLNISYQLSDRFAIHGALEHHLLREQINYIQCDTIQIIQENVPLYTTINEFSGNSHTTFGSRSSSEIQKRTIRENNQYSASEASIRLSYVLFSKKDLDLIALGGLGMTSMQSKGKYIDSNLEIIELSNNNFFNKKSLSSVTILGLRFETDINQKHSFNWGFTYRRHLGDWTPHDEIIIRSSTLNLDVGFRMTL